MRAITVHAALLAVALGAAYVTWSRASDAPAAPGSVQLWEGDEDELGAIRFEGERQGVAIERRTDDGGAYLWGTVTPKAATAVADSGAAPVAPAPPTEFLVGQSGDDLARSLASPRAVRELGDVDEEGQREFGLAQPSGRLVVEVDGRTHELLVGAPVYGSGDRYVKDAESGRVYVMESTLFPPLESPEVLAERRLHTFTPQDVATVVVHTGSSERTMQRLTTAEGGSTWAPEGAPDRTDQSFATFIDRVDQLWADSYAAGVDGGGLDELLRLDYRDAQGEPLGYLRLMRGRGDPRAYYLVTEHSRVPVRPFAGTAEDIARDVDQLFGGGPRAGAAAAATAAFTERVAL